MPLNFNSGTGNYKPYVRYMASTSSWRTADGDFQFKKAIFDLDNVQTGWCLLAEGGAPEWVMDASIDQMAKKPEGDGWKRGFKVDIFSKDMFGDEPTREWGTNAAGATMSMQALFSEFEQSERPAGQVPVVEFQGAVPTKVGKGNTTVPTLRIVKWVDRPAELQDNEGLAVSGSSPSPVTAATTADEDDEF